MQRLNDIALVRSGGVLSEKQKGTEAPKKILFASAEVN